MNNDSDSNFSNQMRNVLMTATAFLDGVSIYSNVEFFSDCWRMCVTGATDILVNCEGFDGCRSGYESGRAIACVMQEHL